jgi:hypothetical protein
MLLSVAGLLMWGALSDVKTGLRYSDPPPCGKRIDSKEREREVAE